MEGQERLCGDLLEDLEEVPARVFEFLKRVWGRLKVYRKKFLDISSNANRKEALLL